jgi:hypothetical protein
MRAAVLVGADVTKVVPASVEKASDGGGGAAQGGGCAGGRAPAGGACHGCRKPAGERGQAWEKAEVAVRLLEIDNS